MPGGDTIDDGTVSRIAATIRDRIGQSIGHTYSITDATRDGWRESFYVERREGIAGRPDREVVLLPACSFVWARLAITFAAIDGATELEPAHIEAAIAWCDYYTLDAVSCVWRPPDISRRREASQRSAKAGAEWTAPNSETCSLETGRPARLTHVGENSKRLDSCTSWRNRARKAPGTARLAIHPGPVSQRPNDQYDQRVHQPRRSVV